jgi:putative oxidoreductase
MPQVIGARDSYWSSFVCLRQGPALAGGQYHLAKGHSRPERGRFGLNGFLHFIHQPPPSDSLTLQFLVAVSASHFAAFFCAVQVVGGLLLLSGYFVPLALILLAAEPYNILAFHLMFESGSGIGPGLLACVLWVLVFLQYRANFNSILTPKPASQP